MRVFLFLRHVSCEISRFPDQSPKLPGSRRRLRLPCSRTKPHSHKPIEICTTLSNECQPLLVHHIFVSGVRVQRRSICAFTIIIALLWREPFLKSPSDFLARLSLFQNFILHLQIASHGQATKYVLQLFGVFFLVLRLDPVQQMFLFFFKASGVVFSVLYKKITCVE